MLYLSNLLQSCERLHVCNVCRATNTNVGQAGNWGKDDRCSKSYTTECPFQGASAAAGHVAGTMFMPRDVATPQELQVLVFGFVDKELAKYEAAYGGMEVMKRPRAIKRFLKVLKWGR